MRTRSSDNWLELPGNWDVLNVGLTFGSTNEWGIPWLEATDAQRIPSALVAYGQRRTIVAAPADAALHFYLDDYRFEPIWKRPARVLEMMRHLRVAVAPDFSVDPLMPRAAQLWNIYRARWIGRFLQTHGIAVIPALRWSDAQSFAYCLLGVPKGGLVAVSARDIWTPLARRRFAEHYRRMLELVEPCGVLCYGLPRGLDLPREPALHVYRARWNAGWLLPAGAGAAGAAS